MSLRKEVEVVLKKRLPKRRKSKIEQAGKEVMDCIMHLTKTTDMGCAAIAKKLNEEFSHKKLKLHSMDISRFFQKNGEAITTLLQDQNAIAEIRQKLLLNYKTIFTKDIQMLDEEIEKILGEDSDLIEPEKRARVVGDLIDKKGKIVMRDAKLSGKLENKTFDVDKMQVNIFQQVSDAKSDVIQKLKSFDAKKEIIVEKNE